MRTVFIITLNWLAVWIGNVQPVPLPELCLDGRRKAHPDPQTQDEFKRARRSIPDWDAIKPGYIDGEVLPDQESLDDPQKDISHFALTDHVSNFFRSQKTEKNSDKAHIKAPSNEGRPVSVARAEEAVDEGDLRSDEQEECYKQQNIDVPEAIEVKPRKALRKKPKALLGHMAPALEEDARRNMWKHRHSVADDNREIMSLYSNPEKFRHTKKAKEYQQAPKPERFKSNGIVRVYKPVDVEATFPVYDEDIDFHPDPLQGILEDKYWLDPQEQEAVIRKYIDLAANNMMPPGVEYAKRSVPKSDSNAGSVDSGKTGFKCPCLDVVACGECSKGKHSKKSNHTPSDDSVSYGRSLLSIDYDTLDALDKEPDQRNLMSPEDDSGLDLNEGAEVNEDIPSFTSNYFGRRLLSLQAKEDHIGSVDYDIGSVSRKGNIHRSRSLLWYYDENEESYDDDDGDDEWQNGNMKDTVVGVHSFGSVVSDEKFNQKVRPVGGIQGLQTRDRSYGKNGEPITDEDFMPIKSPPFELPKQPGYYSSNKLGNVLQKPFQKKPKKSQWNYTTIHPNFEFELMSNKTFDNVTLELNDTAVGGRNSSYSNTFKGRRSYVENPAIKPPTGMPLFSDGPGLGGFGEPNKTANVSQSIAVLNETTVSNNVTSTSENTTEGLNVTQLSTSTTALKSTASTTQKNEELLDSEVANDIVEAVISESQRSSILGHRLGVCRKNENVGDKNRAGYISETEKLFKSVSDCILSKLKSRLAKQSCIVLDEELRDFLSWMVLGGESYRDYMGKVTGKYREILPTAPPTVTTCVQVSPTSPMCEVDPAFPLPDLNEILSASNATASQ